MFLYVLEVTAHKRHQTSQHTWILPLVQHFCSYHMLTSSAFYCWCTTTCNLFVKNIYMVQPVLFNWLIRKQIPNFYLSTRIKVYLFEPKGSLPNPSPNPKLDVKPKLGMPAKGSCGCILFKFPLLLLPGCSNFYMLKSNPVEVLRIGAIKVAREKGRSLIGSEQVSMATSI